MNLRNRSFISKLVLIASLLGGAHLAFGQTKQQWYHISGKSLVELQEKMPLPFKPQLWPFQKFQVKRTKNETPKLMMNTPIPSVYNYHNLAMFCKLEVQLEHTVKFPIKVRLGEVQYVEKMEGKYDY